MENRIAVFIDFENIKRSVDENFTNERVDLMGVLSEIQSVGEGRIVVKRAYADWGYFKDYRSDLLDTATEPVQAFSLSFRGKNGADIRIAIDVMDVVFRQADITHVGIVSGDSDFTPLVMKLRESGKYVIGVGVRSNTSNYLAKACDHFSFYDDLRAERIVGADEGTLSQEALPQPGAASENGNGAHPAAPPVSGAPPPEPMDPAVLLDLALARLGNRAVTGSALKTQMRKIDPFFDETRRGFGSFYDFLRAHEDRLDLHKPAVGDVTVAPKGCLEEDASGDQVLHSANRSFVPVGLSRGGARLPSTPGERYRLWLGDNNFRYVPSEERHQVMRVMYDIFSGSGDEAMSLKEAKDRLHLWFEENRPAVAWESINSTVYHLFYTWCFWFDRSDADDARQLWDRRTWLQSDIHSADELIEKCERGIVRKLWERDRNVDVDALNDWLYEGDPEKRAVVAELVERVAAVGAVGGGRHGGYCQ